MAYLKPYKHFMVYEYGFYSFSYVKNTSSLREQAMGYNFQLKRQEKVHSLSDIAVLLW